MERITKLRNDEVFVFGSNLAGRHGLGAAKTALQWGAVYGVGNGPAGNTYAIPTKDENLRVLPLEQIQLYINDFVAYAKNTPEQTFLVTLIGCGLAGYKPWQIKPLFREANNLVNVRLPEEFQLDKK